MLLIDDETLTSAVCACHAILDKVRISGLGIQMRSNRRVRQSPSCHGALCFYSL